MHQTNEGQLEPAFRKAGKKQRQEIKLQKQAEMCVF